VSSGNIEAISAREFAHTRGVQGVQGRVSTVGTAAQLSIAHFVFGGLTKVQTGAMQTAASPLVSGLTGCLSGML
jgi:hypothetical protein